MFLLVDKSTGKIINYFHIKACAELFCRDNHKIIEMKDDIKTIKSRINEYEL